MEFLVRLEDKTNTQVFCLNPVHKGNHMDRVIYEDATLTAPCPDCKSAEYLYRKNNAISKKGNFITFKEDGWRWGRNERLHYGIVRIDCTYEQAQEWCQTIKGSTVIENRFRKKSFDFENALGTAQLRNWYDTKLPSIVIPIPEYDKALIKEVSWL